MLVNDEATLGALRWVGPPEQGLPVWVVLFDLKAKKLIDKKKRDPGWVTVLDKGFIVDNQLLSSAAKPIAKLPSPHLIALDDTLAEKLWVLSAEWTGLPV